MADGDGVCFLSVDFLLVTHQAQGFSILCTGRYETEGSFYRVSHGY